MVKVVLSNKLVSMGSLDLLLVEKLSLDMDAKILANNFMIHNISKPNRVSTCSEARSLLLE